MMWHTYFSMLKLEKGWLSLALLMDQDNKQFMKTWVFFFDSGLYKKDDWKEEEEVLKQV